MNTKRTMLAGAVALVLSTAGITATLAAPQGSSGASGSMSGSSASGAAGSSSSSMRGSSGSSSSTAQLSSTDRKFINDAASAGMFEVQAAQLAQSKAQDSQNKTYAQQMLADHEKNNQQLMQITQTKGVSPPTKLAAKHQAMLSKLQKASGSDFDQEYAKVMEQSHDDTVKLFEKGEKQVKDTELKSYISQTLPTLHQHHQQASSLTGAKGSSRQAEAGGSGSSSRSGSSSGGSSMGGSGSGSMGGSGSGSMGGSGSGSMSGGSSGSMSGSSGSSSSMGSSTSGNTSSSDTTSGSSSRPGASSGNPDTSTPPKP